MKKPNKILIIDDDETNCEVLVEILEDKYILDIAYSGEEGLKKVSTFRPDIILLDIMMPGMNGYDVCRKIRQNKYLSTTKIILVSAKKLLKDRLVGYEAGADDYITKPFDHNELTAKINVFSNLKYAEELNLLKDDFLTLLTHESKTPLNIIFGYAELLSTSRNLSENEIEFVKAIIESADQLHQKSQKIFLLCRLKKDYDLKLTQTSIVDVIKELMLKNKDNPKNVTIQISPVDIPAIKIDPGLISDALGYLIDNAIKHSDELETVNIDLEIEKNLLRISIMDQGPGIPDDLKEIVFEEFNNQDINHHSEGLGISLAIARKVALLHDGDLKIKDNIPKGAIFEFEIKSNLTD